MKPVLLTVCFAGLFLGQPTRPSGTVARGGWDVNADQQTNDGHIYHLRGHAGVRGEEVSFHADGIDYDEDKGTMHLAGHVIIETKNGAPLHADEADYDVKSGEVKLKLKLLPAR